MKTQFIWPILGIVLLAGCNGIPTKSEKDARKQQRETTADFRPNGKPPILPTLSADSGLSNFLTYAALNHPTVEAAYYDWLASIERITQARSLPDPQFTFQMDIQNAVTSVMPGLMGAIPWPDKLRLGAAVASAESRAKFFAFQSAMLESAYAVKKAYYQLYFLNEKLRITHDNLQLLSNLEQLARSQNEVGKVTLQDVLRAQIEQDRLKTDLINLEHGRFALLAQFKAALGLKAEAPDPTIPSRFESTPLDLTSEKVFDTAMAQNKRLQALHADILAADASITLARKSRLPDVSLGLMADVQANPTLYRLPGNPGTLSLPIWRDKIAAQIAEAQANKRAAEARLSAEQIALAADFAERYHRFQEATRNFELFDHELLPKARQSLEVARSAYLAGQIDFFNLTESERTLLGLELDKAEAASEREIVLTELSLLAQGLTPSTPAMGQPSVPMVSTSSSRKAKASGM